MAFDFTVKDGLAYIADLTLKTVRLAPGAEPWLTNAMVSTSAAIATSKQVNRVHAVYQQMDGATVASTTGEGVAIYVCDKTSGATIKKVSAFVQDSGGTTSNAAVEVKKYDISITTLATILSAAVDVSASEADYETVNGTISDSALATGDVLVVQVVYTSGSAEHQGLCVQVEIDETGA